MSNRIAWGVGACALVAIGVWLAPVSQDDEQALTSKVLNPNTSYQSSQNVSDISEPVVGGNQDSYSLSNDMLSDEVKKQVTTAMQSYDEISQYPPSSQPILGKDYVEAFVNTTSPESSLPYPVEGLEKPIQLSIKLPQYNYFHGDAVEADISVSDIPDNASVTARAVLMDLGGDVLAESGVKLENDDAQSKALSVSFDTLDYNTQTWPLEMTVGSYIEVDGNPLFISAPFRINAETAWFESVGFSSVKEEYLDIPVNLDVVVSGYYFVSGILYSATSGLPLVYLEAEGPLNQGLDSLSLNAHVHALKKGEDEGPYELKNIKVERWSDDTIAQDVSGKVPQNAYSVEGYAFSSYSDVPYIDPLKEERLRLMQGLSTL